MKEKIFYVDGMMCEGCENRVKNDLKNIEGVKDVTADHKTGKVVVTSNDEVSEKSIKDTLDDIGYEVVKED